MDHFRYLVDPAAHIARQLFSKIQHLKKSETTFSIKYKKL
ncbi:hypothetical protein [Polaromonas sp. CG9_12]|nr:hypothetical protein [Polaromonas sp. CG9_12]